MQHARWCLAGLFLLLLSVPACSSDSDDDDKFSESHQLSELNASYGAFADEGRLRVYAALLGRKGFVRLRGGDTIEIDIGGQRTPSTERLLGDKVHYIADVPAPPGETEVTITFVRGLERVVGKIRIYSAFTLTKAPSTLKIGESAEIDIDPRPDLSKWPGFFGPGLIAKAELIGSCLETGSQQIELCAVDGEPGKCTQGYPLKLDPGKLIFTPGSKGCEVAVQVRLNSGGSPFEATGPAKQSFKGGGFEGHRLRSFELQLTQ
ncbi:MAG: hypothetical protein BGO98_28935 [Myxococcales bacterium 68-20]|nr:hypothetical protein [Myxococcales bacterium]OJY30795.1 MAG: hypothetical protein BGO98_28935 [Myxococcales bacterium 68-20]